MNWQVKLTQVISLILISGDNIYINILKKKANLATLVEVSDNIKVLVIFYRISVYSGGICILSLNFETISILIRLKFCYYVIRNSAFLEKYYAILPHISKYFLFIYQYIIKIIYYTRVLLKYISHKYLL